MKKLLSPILMILCAALFLAVMPTEAECAIYEDTVRLHILAPSDSTEDQSLKLEIRDELLSVYGERLSVYESSVEAEKELSEILPEIEKFVNAKIKERGFEYTAKVMLTDEWYETRIYDSFTLPSGKYASLQVIIGEGNGQNWWCVMFPPLCLDTATETEKYTDSEDALISGKYRVKFKILELISETMR